MFHSVELEKTKKFITQGKPGEALEYLSELHVDSSMSNEIALLSSRLSIIEEEYRKGNTTFQVYMADITKLSEDILKFMTEYSIQNERSNLDIKEKFGHLPDYHKHTCNRNKQEREFIKKIISAQNKIHFFFMHGEYEQSHEGLFLRLSYDISGKLLDYNNPKFQSKSKLMKYTINFCSDNIKLIGALYASIVGSLNNYYSISHNTLMDLYNSSPLLKELTVNDHICIYMPFSHYEWDDKKTPETIDWFIQHFCKIDHPTELPTFLFFFGFLYKQQSECKEQIPRALKKVKDILILPELDMVKYDDIAHWFEKYSKIAPESRKRNAIKDEYFDSKQEYYYMEDVELHLAQIIDKYNNKQFATWI